MKKFLLMAFAFMLPFATIAPVHAEEVAPILVDIEASELPDPRSVWIDRTQLQYCTIINATTGVFMYLSVNRPYFSNDDNTRLYVSNSGVDGISYQKYKLNQGEWVFQSDSTASSGIADGSMQLMWTSYDALSHATGEVVFAHDPLLFKASLPEMIQAVVSEEITGTTLPTILGSMASLTVSAISLMACIIGLPIFFKVFSRFLH